MTCNAHIRKFTSFSMLMTPVLVMEETAVLKIEYTHTSLQLQLHFNTLSKIEGFFSKPQPVFTMCKLDPKYISMKSYFKFKCFIQSKCMQNVSKMPAFFSSLNAFWTTFMISNVHKQFHRLYIEMNYIRTILFTEAAKWLQHTHPRTINNWVSYVAM